jgi:hypothetical protein
MTEKALTGTYEQMVIALAERRQRIVDDANRQVASVNEALAQVLRDAARAAGLDEARAKLENKDGRLVLVEVEDGEAAGAG